ncbi:MAG: glutamate 5-kinase [Actinobacteria bacterium]|nr:glutamate 5-kinase [Actinomycetota bacterium]
MERSKYLKKIKRIVVKIGSSSITLAEGGLDLANMKKFTSEIFQLVKEEIEVIIVTSGAIAAGLQYLGIKIRPKDMASLQSAAAVGQVELMRTYSDLLAKNSLKIGQILLTQEDTTKRKQYLNIKNTIENLLKLRVIPLINENDSVAVEEIKFGDNDRLAALVASLTEADLLVLLTDIEGLYDKNPLMHKDAKLISFVGKITPEVEELAGGIGSPFGLGGMVSKIKAARICSFSGISMVIACSKTKDVLKKIVSFEPVGTFFAPRTGKKVKSIKRWIAFGVQTKGSIYLDRGAEEAVESQGKSVLPVGIVEVEGSFNKGDTLKVYSIDKRLIAKGISNFSDEDINNIKGKKEKQILEEFGSDMCCEVIHRDSLVVFEEHEEEG